MQERMKSRFNLKELTTMRELHDCIGVDYIARNKDNTLVGFACKPFKCSDGNWVSLSTPVVLANGDFSVIKCTDNKAVNISKLLKIG